MTKYIKMTLVIISILFFSLMTSCELINQNSKNPELAQMIKELQQEKNFTSEYFQLIYSENKEYVKSEGYAIGYKEQNNKVLILEGHTSNNNNVSIYGEKKGFNYVFYSAECIDNEVGEYVKDKTINYNTYRNSIFKILKEIKTNYFTYNEDKNRYEADKEYYQKKLYNEYNKQIEEGLNSKDFQMTLELRDFDITIKNSKISGYTLNIAILITTKEAVIPVSILTTAEFKDYDNTVVNTPTIKNE